MSDPLLGVLHNAAGCLMSDLLLGVLHNAAGCTVLQDVLCLIPMSGGLLLPNVRAVSDAKVGGGDGHH